MRALLISIGLLLISLTWSCSAQNSEWAKVKSEEALFEVMFPCKPEISKKLFQQVPKEAFVHSFKCEFNGISFSVSLPERFNDFDPTKADEELDGVEQTLRSMIGSKAQIKAKNQLFSANASRELEVDSGNVFGLQLNIAESRGVYGVQAFGKYEKNEDRAKIEEMARKFVGSFKFLEQQ